VIYAGQIVEEATTVELFAEPAPSLHPRAHRRGTGHRAAPTGAVGDPGRVPNLIDLPVGCRFAGRCEARVEAGLTRCVEEMPAQVEVRAGHKARCFLHSDAADDSATPVSLGAKRT